MEAGYYLALGSVGCEPGASWPEFELSLFINNALDSQPTLQVRNYVSTDTLLYATTFRPRTIGLAAKLRF